MTKTETASLREERVRRITGTKRVDRRRKNGLREDIGMQFSLTGRIVRSRMTWLDHLVQMENHKERATRKRGHRKRSRRQLSCVKRGVRQADEGIKLGFLTDSPWTPSRGFVNWGKNYYFVEFLPVYVHFSGGSIAFFRFSNRSVTQQRL